MNCSFDICELWNGIFLGIVSSLIFAIFLHWFRAFFVFKRRYGKLAGNFDGYGYKDKDSGELNERPISHAIIKFVSENRLEITVTHGDQEKYIWVGEITLNTLKHGIIVWQYVEPIRVKHFFGYKQCIIENDFNTIIIIGDEGKGYGKEIFKRV